MDIWHVIGEQLRHPRGVGGRVIGHAMRWANDQPTRLAVGALSPGPCDHVLDVGCGPGHAVALLARRVPNGRIVGIDRSETMIAQARAATVSLAGQGGVELMMADFDALLFPPESFDGILASNVIYFWQDPAGMTARLKTLLRRNGRLAIYATAESSMRAWKFAQTDTHRWIDLSMLKATLLAGGFAPDQIDIRPVRLRGGVDGLIAVANAG